MKQNIEVSSRMAAKWVFLVCNADRERLRNDISNILHPRFHHPHAAIMPKTLQHIDIWELTGLYSFLTDEIIKPRNSFQRPDCPVKSPNQHVLARYEYKKLMVDYILGFGYELKEGPCSYPTAFLEALANYLEDRASNK